MNKETEVNKSEWTGRDAHNSPIVGIVVTISPNLSLYRIVVLPAASNPTIRMRISFFPKRPLKRLANMLPIFATFYWKMKHDIRIKIKVNKIYSPPLKKKNAPQYLDLKTRCMSITINITNGNDKSHFLCIWLIKVSKTIFHRSMFTVLTHKPKNILIILRIWIT